jgi:hypothetical protein
VTNQETGDEKIQGALPPVSPLPTALRCEGGEAPCKKSVRNIYTNIYTYLLLNFEFFLSFLWFLSFL